MSVQHAFDAFVNHHEGLCGTESGIVRDEDHLKIRVKGVPFRHYNVILSQSTNLDAAKQAVAILKTLEPTRGVYMLFLPPAVTEAPGFEGQLQRVAFMPVLVGGVAHLKALEELPTGARIQSVTGPDRDMVIGDLYAAAEGMPLEKIRQSMPFFQEGDQAFSYVLKVASGEAVATCTAVSAGNVLRLTFFATLPTHRKRGYGWLLLQHALVAAREATGATELVIASSEEGAGLYRRLGAVEMARVGVYILSA